MSRVSIIVIEGDFDLAVRCVEVFGFDEWESDIYPDAESGLKALEGDKPYDLILTGYTEQLLAEEMSMLYRVFDLGHRKHIPIVMLAENKTIDNE